jgi:hypothetical protein
MVLCSLARNFSYGSGSRLTVPAHLQSHRRATSMLRHSMHSMCSGGGMQEGSLHAAAAHCLPPRPEQREARCPADAD